MDASKMVQQLKAIQNLSAKLGIPISQTEASIVLLCLTVEDSLDTINTQLAEMRSSINSISGAINNR